MHTWHYFSLLAYFPLALFSQPTTTDSREAFMAYCKERKTHFYICIQSSVANKTAGKMLGTPTAGAAKARGVAKMLGGAAKARKGVDKMLGTPTAGAAKARGVAKMLGGAAAKARKGVGNTLGTPTAGVTKGKGTGAGRPA